MLWLEIKSWLRREEGQDLPEYALLLGLIALIAMVAIAFLGTSISNVLSTVTSTLASAVQ